MNHEQFWLAARTLSASVIRSPNMAAAKRSVIHRIETVLIFYMLRTVVLTVLFTAEQIDQIVCTFQTPAAPYFFSLEKLHKTMLNLSFCPHLRTQIFVCQDDEGKS